MGFLFLRKLGLFNYEPKKSYKMLKFYFFVTLELDCRQKSSSRGELNKTMRCCLNIFKNIAVNAVIKFDIE